MANREGIRPVVEAVQNAQRGDTRWVVNDAADLHLTTAPGGDDVKRSDEFQKFTSSVIRSKLDLFMT
jgi:hypothetical protein